MQPNDDDRTKMLTQADSLTIPTKSDVIAALQSEDSKGGLQLEWVLDRIASRTAEGAQ